MTTDNKTLLLKGLPSKLGKHDVQAFIKKATNNLVFLQVYPWRFGPEEHQALAVLRFEDAENTRLAYSRIASLIETSKAKECSFDPTYLRVHFKNPHSEREEKRNRYKPICPKCGMDDCLYFVFFKHH